MIKRSRFELSLTNRVKRQLYQILIRAIFVAKIDERRCHWTLRRWSEELIRDHNLGAQLKHARPEVKHHEAKTRRNKTHNLGLIWLWSISKNLFSSFDFILIIKKTRSGNACWNADWYVIEDHELAKCNSICGSISISCK